MSEHTLPSRKRRSVRYSKHVVSPKKAKILHHIIDEDKKENINNNANAVAEKVSLFLWVGVEGLRNEIADLLYRRLISSKRLVRRLRRVAGGVECSSPVFTYAMMAFLTFVLPVFNDSRARSELGTERFSASPLPVP